MQAWQRRVRVLKRDTLALWLAGRDPRTPWYARLFAAGVVAYAFSPIDLIPDFIPVLGYLDDLILVPLGLVISVWLIPPEVMRDSRAAAQARLDDRGPTNWLAGAIIIGIWLLLAAVAVGLALNWAKGA